MRLKTLRSIIVFAAAAILAAVRRSTA